MTATGKKRKQTYKDSLFCDMYHDEGNLCDLASFFMGRRVRPEEIKREDLDNVFFSGWKNDISFRVGNQWFILIEHQSTLNENMPLRFFIYLARLWAKKLPNKAIYKKRLIKMPMPIFIVLYNGRAKAPSHWTMRLSDSFENETEEVPQLELIVEAYNINYNRNRKILKRCSTLLAYSAFVYKLRELEPSVREGVLTRQEAVKEAMQYCIEHGYMAEYFSRKQEEEVFDMIDFEWSPELEREAAIDDARDEGKEMAMVAAIRSLMENMKWTAEKAMKELNVPTSDMAAYRALL